MDNSYQNEAPVEHVLDDLGIQLTQASKNQRLVNFLVDRGLLYFSWRFLVIKLTVTIISYFKIYIENRPLFIASFYLFMMAFDLLFYVAFEAFTGGKSLGKYITGTRAVNTDGTRVSPKTALLRGLSRIVPFEVFSALGNPCYPWHDRWTNTYVIDESSSILPSYS